ncbi:MAG: hypothetical protein QXF14_03915 [Candidatus Woesearchaeota archaeon]
MPLRISKKQEEIHQVPITEFRSVKIRKDLFELLKLYCLCHKQNMKDIVTQMFESKLETFKNHLEEMKRNTNQMFNR